MVVWSSDQGWHESDQEYVITLDDHGRIKWAKINDQEEV